MQDKRRQLPGTRTREIPSEQGLQLHQRLENYAIAGIFIQIKNKTIRNKNSFKLFHCFVSGHLKTETFVIMYLQQKCQKQRQKTQKECRKGWSVGGKCFIFLQQNSLIFFYVETAETATETEIRERCKKGRKNAKSEKAKIQWVCVCGWI